MTRRCTMSDYLHLLVVCLWLMQNNGSHAAFKIFRDRRDIFSKNWCVKDSCKRFNCTDYHAECVDVNCRYCQCNEGTNTFVVNNIQNKELKRGECKSDEYVVPESVPGERFSLRNLVHNRCLTLESGTNKIIGTNCTSASLDTRWVWTKLNSDYSRELMNVKTLTCVRKKNNNRRINMVPCQKNNIVQKLYYHQSPSESNTAFIYFQQNSENQYLHLDSKGTYAISKKHEMVWSKRLGHYILPEIQKWKGNRADTFGKYFTYKGCYRFKDGSYMAYLDYSQTDPLQISAPIFKDNNICEVEPTYEHMKNGQTWTSTKSNFFSIKKRQNRIDLTLKRTQEFKALNGSLLKINISCKRNGIKLENHCVLIKLKSLPTFSEVINTTLRPSRFVNTQTREVSNTRMTSTTGLAINSLKPKTSTTRLSSVPVLLTTDTPQKGAQDTSQSGETSSSVAIAVSVTLFTILLVLAVLGYFVYFKRRKRAQPTQNNNEDFGAEGNARHIYEEPDRIYETVREDGNEASSTQPGTTHDTYTYPDNNGIGNPITTEQEYSYATDVDMPMRKVDRGIPEKNSTPAANGAFYHNLERDKQPSSDFYSYPDRNINTNPESTKLEYAYAKPTSPVSTATEEDAFYHTVE